jgi:hypothetical protein
MSYRTLAGLAVFNAVLLAALGLLSFTPPRAEAQIGRSGSYVMIAGASIGKQADTLYIMDLNSAHMMAVYYDMGQKRLQAIAARDINPDFNAAAGR